MVKTPWVPCPVIGIVWGLPATLSAMLSAAVVPPGTGGLKTALIVQVAAGASVDGQLFVCEYSKAFAPVMVMVMPVMFDPPVLVITTGRAPELVPTGH